MSDSLLSHPSKLNRLDPPHDLMAASNGAPKISWLAMAGRDPKALSDQLDRQTSELLAYVQKQNDEIDERQAELNAKLARLDSELRTARLRTGLDVGADLLRLKGSGGERGMELDEQPLTQLATPPTNPDAPESVPITPTAPERTAGEFEEVERIVAQYTAKTSDAEADQPESAESTPDESRMAVVPANIEARLEAQKSFAADKFRRNEVHPDGIQSDRSDSSTTEKAARKSVDPFPEMLKKSHLSRIDSGVDIQAMATSLDASELESERRLLAERKIELDRRKSVLQRMQDETQTLHREAIEMRLVTEQLWIELSGKAPADHLNELLASLRARLDERYSAQQELLEGRKHEMVELKRLIERKQDDVREQSKKLQDWVETRHDEIKAYAAEVDAREMLLDRREHRMNDEFSKWEAQRVAYQDQLQGLLKKLNLAGLGE